MLRSILPARSNLPTSPISFWNNKSKYWFCLRHTQKKLSFCLVYVWKVACNSSLVNYCFIILKPSRNKSQILSFLAPALNALPIACGIHVFVTPFLPSGIFFLGKPVWILESDGWIKKFTTRSLKLLDSTVRFTPIAIWKDTFFRRSHL